MTAKEGLDRKRKRDPGEDSFCPDLLINSVRKAKGTDERNPLFHPPMS